MRTTLSVDAELLEKARALAAQRRLSLRSVINDAIRAGLEQAANPPRRRPYRTRPHAMGLRPGLDLDNIQELLADLEGEDAR